jgi:predicted metal-dependent phosphoesterase TrpH
MDVDASDIQAVYAAVLAHHGGKRLAGRPMRRLVATCKSQDREVTEKVAKGVRPTVVVQENEVGQQPGLLHRR